MKKSRTMRAAALLLALTLMTSCFVGGTFAKYTSTATATDTATVAKWDIKVTGTGEAQTISVATPPAITFGLFDTAKEVDGTTADADVRAGKIAPGSGGAFSFKIENDSDVTAKYTVKLTAATGDIPIEYSKTGADGSWTTNIAELEMTATLGIDSAAATTETVYWRWAFTGSASENYQSTQSDDTDTTLGINGSATMTVTATITVEQVD